MDINTLKTLNYYNGISQGYSELYHDEQKSKIELIMKHLPINGIILDLGSGDGVINSFLSNQVSLVSLDLSYELLTLNTSKNKINASINNIPIKNKSIDGIISFTVIQDVENIEKAFSEIIRILKVKGILILSFLKLSKKKLRILNEIEKGFIIDKKIEHKKDVIIIAKKK